MHPALVDQTSFFIPPVLVIFPFFQIHIFLSIYPFRKENDKHSFSRTRTMAYKAQRFLLGFFESSEIYEIISIFFNKDIFNNQIHQYCNFLR
jgi:hypothetical protein